MTRGWRQPHGKQCRTPTTTPGNFHSSLTLRLREDVGFLALQASFSDDDVLWLGLGWNRSCKTCHQVITFVSGVGGERQHARATRRQKNRPQRAPSDSLCSLRLSLRATDHLLLVVLFHGRSGSSQVHGRLRASLLLLHHGFANSIK